MGKISDENDKVFVITLPGFDVDTAEPEECSIHSGFDYPKIEEQNEGYDIVTIPSSVAPGDTTVLTKTHNYGYAPCWFVFLDDIDNNLNVDFAKLPFTEAMPVDWFFRVETTTTQMKVILHYDDLWGVGNMTPTDYHNIPGKRFGFKWQIWVND